MKRAGSSLLCCLLCAPLLAAPRLEYSGVLGQSQPPGLPPLPFIGPSGVAVTADGGLWVISGNLLLAFRQEGGRWDSHQRWSLPDGCSHLGARFDGRQLYWAGWDNRLHRVTPGQNDATVLGPAKLFEKARSYAVAPVGLERGFAARNRVFVLAGDSVQAVAPDGQTVNTVLRLSRPAGADWAYCAVGLEPTTGDLLVGSYYPDSKVYRYRADGGQVTTDGWPRGGHAALLVSVDRQAWIVDQGGSCRPLPLTAGRQTGGLAVGGFGAMYPSGLARDAAGHYWLASSQGVTEFDGKGRPTGVRLGGVSGVRSLAVGADGTLVALVENGQRTLRLAIDDEPTTPLRCNANEPWRVAGGWSNRGAAVAWDGALFAVLDEVGGQLWQFDPWHTGYKETPWLKRTEAKSLTAPRHLAVGDTQMWVLDGAVVRQADVRAAQFGETALPGLSEGNRAVGLAAVEDDLLVIAWPKQIRAWRRGADSSLAPAWSSTDGWQRLAGVAVAAGHVAVSDAGGQCLALLDAATGQRVAECGAASVPGGWQPGCVTGHGAWVVVADEAGQRLVRLRVRR